MCFDMAQARKVETLPLQITREALLEAVERNIRKPQPDLVTITAG
jgi:hypothetical protein